MAVAESTPARAAHVLEARGAVALLVAAVGLTGLTAALGPSVVESPLGPHGGVPLRLELSPDAWLVVAMLVAAYVLGAAALALGLDAVRRGWRPDGRRLLAASAVAAAALAVLPPIGSADSLSYAAYGRIAAAGDNPYVVAPDRWRGGTDPVASAVERPWRSTPSVYGPVATGEQALASALGGSSVSATVAWLSVLNAAAFWVTGWLLMSLAGPDADRRSRAGLLWALNPLLLTLLVAGGHVDTLGVAWVVAGVAVLRRWPLAAGVLLGLAVATKASFALFVLAALWPFRHRWRDAVAVGAGAGLTTLATYSAVGWQSIDQLREASRYVSLATPMNLVTKPLDDALGTGVSRPLMSAVSLLAGVLVTVALVRGRFWRRRPVPHEGRDDVRDDALRAWVVLAAAWLLTASYSLPWYDAALWAPLSVVSPSLFDGLAIARTTSLAVAYVPGRVEIPGDIARPTLFWRSDVTPWIGVTLVLAVLAWAWQAPRRIPAGRRPRPRRAGAP